MIEVYQDDIGVFNCQKKFVERILKILRRFGCKLVNVPLIVNEKLMKDDGEKKVDAIFNRCLVGNLLYFSYKPNVMFAASLLYRFMKSPSHFHLGAAKKALRYIQYIMEHGIKFD
jgi:hypothetical protein